MDYKNFLNKLDYLEKLISNEKTGTAKELACKLEISRRTLFNYFSLLRDKGFEIGFSRIRNTYYFKNKC